MEYLAVVVVCLAAAVVQAVTGFGFGLVAVPALAILVDPVIAVLLTSLVAGPLSASMTLKERRLVDRVSLTYLAAGGLLVMPLGVWLLATGPDQFLTALFAATVLGFTIALRRGLSIKPNVPRTFMVGCVSGALAGATGMGGPPVVMYLQAMHLPASIFRATVSAVVTFQAVPAVLIYTLAGLIDRHALGLGLAGFLSALVGWGIGQKIFLGMDQARFRTWVELVLIGSAIVALAGTII